MIRTSLMLSMLAVTATMAACDSPMTGDGGIDAHADVIANVDATRIDAAPNSDVMGTDIFAPFDGASGIGNGTCAETGSFCLAGAQCCSGFCNTTTMWSGGGICDVHAGTSFAGDAGAEEAGDCLHPCHCPSNQHCCLVSQASAACGVALQCSVIEGCQ